jgi:hypothetical protein
MPAELPSFDTQDVALLVSAVERALEHLRLANEKLDGGDPELLEYGRRYSLILQKLQAIYGTR